MGMGILGLLPMARLGQTGKRGKAVNFDGSDDFVQSGSLGLTITNKTLMAWVNLKTLSQTGGGVIGL